MVTRGKSLDKVQIAYAAGIFDGEGCITSYISDRGKEARTNYVLTRACVVNTNLKVIKLLHGWFGGRIDKKVTGHPVWNDCYVWTISSHGMVDFLKRIMPYLQIKKIVSQIAIDLKSLDATGYLEPIKTERKKKQLELFKRLRAINKSNGNGHPQRLSEETEAGVFQKR